MPHSFPPKPGVNLWRSICLPGVFIILHYSIQHFMGHIWWVFPRLISLGSNKNIVSKTNIDDFSFLSFWVHDDLCCLCKYRSLSPTAKDVKIGHMICFVSTSSIRTSASTRIPHLCDRLIWSSTRSSRISFSPTLTYLLATLVPHTVDEESNSQRLSLP